MLDVIGFSGSLHSGKTTAANLLVKMGYTRVPFAKVLKMMGKAAGLTVAQLHGSLEDKNRSFVFVPSDEVKANMLSCIDPGFLLELGIDYDHAFDLLDVTFPRGPDYVTTARRFMQLLGTEWGRALNENFWVTLWSYEAEAILRDGGRVVCDDVRFPNELEVLHRYHPRNLIEIQCAREDLDVGVAGHASEIVQPGDAVVFNSKRSTAELWERLQEAMAELENESVS